MKILIVEDEKDLLDEMASYLSEQGFLCEKAATYREAEDKLSLYEYTVILLDITLPGGNGLHLLSLIKKKNPESGVLIVSAKDSLNDKLKGLDLGADDYITKPFHMAELNARINALIRRKNFKGSNALTFEEIHINAHAKTVSIHEKALDLTRKEYELLLYMVVNKNKVLSKKAIAEHLWGDDYDMTGSYDFVYVHMNNLRKKLLLKGAHDYIKTIYGMGYKFTAS